MKALIYLFSAVLGTIGSLAQAPVHLDYNVNKTGNNTYEVHIKATIETPWHIYSVSTAKGGPAPTKIVFNKNPFVLLSGKFREDGKLVGKFEDAFGVDVKYFEKTVDFVQPITIKGNVKTSITGSISYMICDDERCLPTKIEKFNIPIK